MLDESFDPVIDRLEPEIRNVLVKHPEIKVASRRSSIPNNSNSYIHRRSSFWGSLGVVPIICAIEWLRAI
jgi:hypothetical protein